MAFISPLTAGFALTTPLGQGFFFGEEVCFRILSVRHENIEFLWMSYCHTKVDYLFLCSFFDRPKNEPKKDARFTRTA